MNLFRKTSIASDPVVRRSSLTIREALEAARQAGMQTPDTGLFERWLRAKGLSSRGNILISRMRQEYEQAFEERFNGQIAFSRDADFTSPRSGAGHLGGGSQAHSDGNCPIVVQPADPKKLNRLFLERQKGGDAPRPDGQISVEPAQRNEGGSNPPSPDSIAALYASGKASSLKEALAILGGGR